LKIQNNLLTLLVIFLPLLVYFLVHAVSV